MAAIRHGKRRRSPTGRASALPRSLASARARGWTDVGAPGAPRSYVACLSEWIRTAGFDTVRRVAEPFRLDAVEVMQQGYVALEAR